MTANLNDMYDEVLRGEFSSRGKHAAPEAGPTLREAARPHGLHMAVADAPIHDEFEAKPLPAAVEEAPVEGEGPRGFARYRNAVMVGAGGLACAAAGAFLGGLGGYFTVNPAAAHSLASSVSPEQSAAGGANQGAASASGTEAVVTAALTALSGSLTQNAAPLQWLTAQSGTPGATTGTLADLSGAGSGSDTGAGASAGSGAGSGNGSGCTATTSDLGLGCVVGSLTSALGSVGTLPSDPTEELSTLVPSLTDVITDVTGTLADLGSLMPITSLPLPAGGLPSLGLPGLAGLPGLPGLGGLGGIPGLGTVGSGLPGVSGTGTSLLSGTGAITALLDGVTAAATGATGGTGTTSTTIPSLPIVGSGSGSGSLVPSLPVTASAGGKATTPAGSASGGTTSGSTTSTSTTTTTVTVPLPALPLPVSTPPVSVGGVSVGVGTSGSGSGLTLSLP